MTAVKETSILPYGLEYDKNCIANGIQNLPKSSGGRAAEIFVKESEDGEVWFHCEVDNERQAVEVERDLISMHVPFYRTPNPIYGMDEAEINTKICECIKKQPKQWQDNYKKLIMQRSDACRHLGFENVEKLNGLIKKYGLEKGIEK